MIQVYTGEGKGKTTAALGLALRACGAGLNVYICQFVKGRYYSELAALKKLKNIKLVQFGRRCFIKSTPKAIDKEMARKGFFKAREAVLCGKFDLVVLDEINIAVKLGLIRLEELIGLLDAAPKGVEVILTGRYASPQVLRKADLVSDIAEKKHYYKRGVKARRGIEF